MKKIAIVLDTLITGGAHRVALLHAQMLKESGYHVELILLVKPKKINIEIPKDLKIISLITNKHIDENPSLLSRVKRHLLYTPLLITYLKKTKPDLVFSHIQGVNIYAIIASIINKIPIISMEHTTHLLPTGYKKLFSLIERKFIYKLTNCLIVLTKTEHDYYSKFLKDVRILPNPIFLPIITKDKAKSLFYTRKKTILAVGDLNRIHIKGWDNLLLMFKSILVEHSDWKLVFIGPSENNIGKNILKKTAQKLQIIDSVEFMDARQDMENIYQSEGILIVTSRNEGFSLVLVEAMSQGCPVISFDCASGPSDIITPNVDGILVSNQNKDEMIKKVISLINEADSRLKMSLNAIKNVQRFSIDQIQIKLNSIIQEILEDK